MARNGWREAKGQWSLICIGIGINSMICIIVQTVDHQRYPPLACQSGLPGQMSDGDLESSVSQNGDHFSVWCLTNSHTPTWQQGNMEFGRWRHGKFYNCHVFSHPKKPHDDDLHFQFQSPSPIWSLEIKTHCCENQISESKRKRKW